VVFWSDTSQPYWYLWLMCPFQYVATGEKRKWMFHEEKLKKSCISKYLVRVLETVEQNF